MLKTSSTQEIDSKQPRLRSETPSPSAETAGKGPVTVVPYEEGHRAAAAEFNRRIAPATESRLPSHPVPLWLPSREGDPLREENYLALQGGAVRGGYTLKYQPFVIGGREHLVAGWHEAMSEGIVDKRFGLVGVRLLRDALARHPTLLCVGMGGLDSPVARLLKGMGWKPALAGFQFRALKVTRVLRGLSAVRKTPLRAAALDLAAFGGAGRVVIGALQAWRGRGRPSRSEYDWSVEASFGSWADDVWTAARNDYSMVGLRSANALARLYPSPDVRFGPDVGGSYIKLLVKREGRPLGWALLVDLRMRENPHFGNLRVGLVADCLARPRDAAQVIAAATDYFELAGADLVCSNQLDDRWRAAFRRCGYWDGPSNHAVALSPSLMRLMAPVDSTLKTAHITRGDGEGVLHRGSLKTQTPLPPIAIPG